MIIGMKNIGKWFLGIVVRVLKRFDAWFERIRLIVQDWFFHRSVDKLIESRRAFTLTRADGTCLTVAA